MFAVRAFKSAIFGTPHPDRINVRDNTEPAEQKGNVAKVQTAEKAERSQANGPLNDYPDEPVATLKVDPLLSPTKGILLTPGTGATRRKTVSFGDSIADAQQNEEQSPSPVENRDSALHSKRNPEVPKAGLSIQPRHSSLTKTLIELSKQKSNKQAALVPSTQETTLQKTPAPTFKSPIEAQNDDADQIADDTVDLNQPRSRSGQHWKTEYEQYHRRSNLEMKNIIMHGQNVKSYAVKKDCEATGLGEKLKKELAKVASMETKVSKLAGQLKKAHCQGPEGEGEQTRLVAELAQQTALAIRYKQKADRYRKAMLRERRVGGSDGEPQDLQINEETGELSIQEANLPENPAWSAEKDILYAELESLRVSAGKAEDQAAKLEAENGALKQSLARVKGEMMSYESRRQSREERFKRKEAKCKADHKACQAQLAKLTVEHRNLLLASGQASKAETLVHLEPLACYDGLRELNGNPSVAQGNRPNSDERNCEPLEQTRTSKPYISPRKSRPQKSTIDIWTLSSPRDGADNGSPSKEATEMPPSSVRHDIYRTLKEIDHNLIPEEHLGPKSSSGPRVSHTNTAHKSTIPTMSQPASGKPSPVHNMHNRRDSLGSSQPVMIDLTSSPAKEVEPREAIVKPPVKDSIGTLGRSSSLMSRVGSRTSTMTSGRGPALPAERAAAAKARLAARSAEKRKGQENRG